MRDRVFSHQPRLIRILSGLVLLAVLGLAQLLGVYAAGVLFVSPTGNDANNCLTMAGACKTIPAAVSKALSGDTVIIASGHYTEGIAINKDLTLIGFGADATIINQGRIEVTTASVRIYDLAITNGDAQDGGGLYNWEGDVTLEDVSVLNNHAGNGGGIVNFSGKLTLDHTTVAGNRAFGYGGGIYNNGGSVMVSLSTIFSNTACNYDCTYNTNFGPTASNPGSFAPSFGGGIANQCCDMSIDASTIMSNSATNGAGAGDGIYNEGTLVITNSTISNNTGSIFGLDNERSLVLTNVTLDGSHINLANYGVARVQNTIIANSTAGGNCWVSAIVSLGHNLADDNSCNLHATGDVTNTNPLLGPLQDNGGPTPTQALLPGSPAINRGDDAGCPTTDQRGVARPQGVVCDIGAYEFVFTDTFFAPVMTR